MMIDKLAQRLKKDKKIIGISVMGGILFTICFGFYTKQYAETVQTNIANEVIRFHVRANSNSDEDQTLKVAVKDAVLENFQAGLSETKNIEESREFLLANLDNIEKCASAEIQNQGYQYPVTVSLTDDYFPTKVYGDISLPPGKYEALRIDIGEAEGNNWWCVMFPPLCYVDITQKSVSDTTKSKFKDVLTEDEYDLISQAKSDGKLDIQVKFKVVEMWQNQMPKQEVYVQQ